MRQVREILRLKYCYPGNPPNEGSISVVRRVPSLRSDDGVSQEFPLAFM
jgi:hypothetical protein